MGGGRVVEEMAARKKNGKLRFRRKRGKKKRRIFNKKRVTNKTWGAGIK